MGAKTGIEWCDHTFNPWIGCTHAGPGCDHCYAERMSGRFGVTWGPGQTRKITSAANWRQPLVWDRKAARDGMRRRVFCASLADVFDHEAPDEWRERLWSLIDATPHLDWLLLTKRIGNADKMIPRYAFERPERGVVARHNVWLGATACNQEEANRDIPKLLAVPAAVRFVSYEPALGLVNFGAWLYRRGSLLLGPGLYGGDDKPRLNWIIAGAESGPGARPAHSDWFRQVRGDCKAAGVPFFMKQLSGLGGRPIKDMADFPADLRVREYPHA